MGTVAQSAYRSAHKDTGTEESQVIQMQREATSIATDTATANSQADLLELHKRIKTLQETGYRDEHTLDILKSRLYDRLGVVQQACEQECDRLTEETEKIKNESFTADSALELRDLNAQADAKLLELYTKLGTNKDRNKRIISEAVQKKDRATAVALQKLLQNPAYSHYFSDTAKNTIADNAMNPLQRTWLKSQNTKLQKVSKRHAHAIMERFRLGKMESLLKPAKSAYFRN